MAPQQRDEENSCLMLFHLLSSPALIRVRRFPRFISTLRKILPFCIFTTKFPDLYELVWKIVSVRSDDVCCFSPVCSCPHKFSEHMSKPIQGVFFFTVLLFSPYEIIISLEKKTFKGYLLYRNI